MIWKNNIRHRNDSGKQKYTKWELRHHAPSYMRLSIWVATGKVICAYSAEATPTFGTTRSHEWLPLQLAADRDNICFLSWLSVYFSRLVSTERSWCSIRISPSCIDCFLCRYQRRKVWIPACSSFLSASLSFLLPWSWFAIRPREFHIARPCSYACSY